MNHSCLTSLLRYLADIYRTQLQFAWLLILRETLIGLRKKSFSQLKVPRRHTVFTPAMVIHTNNYLRFGKEMIQLNNYSKFMIKQICSGGVGVPCYRTTQWVRLNFTEGKNNSLLKWRNRIGFKKSEMYFEINSILNRRWGPTWKQWGQTLHCRVRRKLAPRCHFSHPHLGGMLCYTVALFYHVPNCVEPSRGKYQTVL